MSTLLILNARLVNEGLIRDADVFVRDGFIEYIGTGLARRLAHTIIDARGSYLLPGIIDDQVHFREPGLTHKATIHSEARAAVAGGVTSFMEMPNTVPGVLTQALLADKYRIAEQTSLANYSFYMGASNDNRDEVLRTDQKNVCGIKIFMGSSTGNMLVDNEKVLEDLFRESPMLIATHCEDEATIRTNAARYWNEYGEEAPAYIHPLIRSEEACWKSSFLAVELARKYATRLHVLHISTADELSLFCNDIPLIDKRITAEVCVHHLWFSSEDYERLGNQIKCNPAIKDPYHRSQLWRALLDDRLDVVATDHAPHTWAEKQQPYRQAPSGLPLVQHSLPMMLDAVYQKKLTIEKVVEKMCHAPADCFQVDRRGYVREGYWADLVLVDPDQERIVTGETVHYQCGWSPLEGTTLHGVVTHTIVSGHLAYVEGQFDESIRGKRLLFVR